MRGICTFGSGRQALATLDKYFGFQRSVLAHKAMTEIQNLTIASVQHLETYVTKFRMYLNWMEQG